MTRFLSTNTLSRLYDVIGTLQDTQAFYEDPALEVLLRYGDFGTASVVYEAGCGTGRVARQLLQGTLASNCRYIGVDVSARMVGIARARVAAFPNATVLRGDVTEHRCEVRPQRVLSLFVVDLMDAARIESFLGRAHESLEDGGRLCIAGLSVGGSKREKLVSSLWERVHGFAPALVGGCRPGSVLAHLDPARWRVLHSERTCHHLICSEAVVAEKA